MKQYLSSSVFLLLAGCSATVNKTYLPNGEQGYAIDCSSVGAKSIDCYEQAGSVCGSKGYEVISAGDLRLSNRGMLIRCK